MRCSAQAGEWKTTAALALAICCMFSAGLALGQSGTRGTPGTSPSTTSSANRTGNNDPNLITMPPMDLPSQDDSSLRMLRLNARRDDIKKRMTQYAARLLQLTTELKADLQTREPTEADGKRLDEIAKLAHAVRDQMRQ